MFLQRSFPLLAALALLSGCNALVGSGKKVEENRSVAAFTSVAIHHGMHLHVVQGPAASVKLIGDDNLVPEITTKVVAGKLQIDLDDTISFTSNLGLHAEVTVPKLEGISGSGGSQIEAEGIDVDAFELELSGGSSAQLSGKASSLTVAASGGSAITATELPVKTARLEMSGGSTAKLAVSDEVRVSLSGGSTVKVTGRPAIKEQNLSGGSSITVE